MSITTGCFKYSPLTRIDDMLQGFHSDDLIQWAGPPSCGKTQLAHLLALQTALDHSGLVLYLDSGTNFSAKRLMQLYSYSDRYQTHRSEKKSIRKVLKRIIWMKCFDHKELQVILDDLAQNQDFSEQLSLVIIDSLGSILSPLSTPKGQNDLKYSISKIIQIQKKFEFPIVAINNSVSLGEQDRLVCDGSIRTNTKPALGYAWASVITKSLYFTPSADRLQQRSVLLSGGHAEEDVLSFENANGVVFPVVECVVERVKGTTVSSTSIYVGRCDIISL